MKMVSLDFIAEATAGKIFSELEKSFLSIGTDTRKDLTGQLFIALKGDNFDAHDYLLQAVEKGAAGLLVHRFPEELGKLRGKVSIIVVKDTLKAMQDLARAIRLQAKSSVIAITGSNGKTTTKEFAAAILSSKKKVHYSKGSFNNHWGLPLSIFQESEDSEISILEMGMNHAGEITELCKIALPDVVVCTSVGRAHIEHFGTIEKIAEAKAEIYEAAPKKARRIYNLDNPLTQKMFLQARKKFPLADRILSFSQINNKADIFMQIQKISIDSLTIKGKILNTEGEAIVPIFGAHNLVNVMAASAVAVAIGMKPEDIFAALPRCKTNWGRNQLIETKNGTKILFDAYNANPDSMNALLENVSILKDQKKIGVFAEMLELGDQAAISHQELGQKVGSADFDQVWFYGPHADDFVLGLKNAGFAKKIFASKDFDEKILKEIIAPLTAKEVMIIKGSRGMKLERVVMACEPIGFSMSKE